MWNMIKKVTAFFKDEKPQAEESKASTGPEMAGSYNKRENIGKKVFEKTGKIREGVGQSSTHQSSPVETEKNTSSEQRVKPATNMVPDLMNQKANFNKQNTPGKTNQGIKNLRDDQRNKYVDEPDKALNQQNDPVKTNQGIQKRKNVVGRNADNKKSIEARKRVNPKVPNK